MKSFISMSTVFSEIKGNHWQQVRTQLSFIPFFPLLNNMLYD